MMKTPPQHSRMETPVACAILALPPSPSPAEDQGWTIQRKRRRRKANTTKNKSPEPPVLRPVNRPDELALDTEELLESPSVQTLCDFYKRHPRQENQD
ncbi:hypothetical protein E2C01_015763 [Portunus trituberculatus]|uniref:Uncharacterized protein n=1 Tax=Portunus trituberculatus TaxID=210409 RepID=A0A5B7DMC2_PORTR|nr:hypothetical protein [Portunus trituberculatus]